MKHYHAKPSVQFPKHVHNYIAATNVFVNWPSQLGVRLELCTPLAITKLGTLCCCIRCETSNKLASKGLVLLTAANGNESVML